MNVDVVRSCTERMKPAQQRSIGPIMAKLARSVPAASQGEKENVPDEPVHDDFHLRKSSSGSRPPPIAATKNNDRQPPSTPRNAAGTKGSQKPRSPHNEAHSHPLIGSSGPANLEKSRAALRSMTWPEYPEEPLGSDIFNQLKKGWSAVLPAKSAAAFFPAGGIRKTDDGKEGCELLSKAILMERSGKFELYTGFSCILVHFALRFSQCEFS